MVFTCLCQYLLLYLQYIKKKMDLKEKLLRYKYFNAEQKLLLLVIGENECNVKHFEQPCILSSQEIADKLGLTRTKIQDQLWELTELDALETKVENKIRYTSLTKRCRNLINKEK
mgnify:FL=1